MASLRKPQFVTARSISWIDSIGTPFSLKLNQELETFLNEHDIEKIEKVNAVLAKRIKKECLKIRDAFFEKTQVLINPKHPKTGVELSNEELSTQGVTASFVVRGQAGDYGISWINTLGKAAPIALESYPELHDFLSCQDTIEGEELIQLKAHLVQVKTTHAIGMGDFKTKLQDCLLRRPAVSKETQAAPSKRLDLGLFKDLERCLGRQAGKSQESELVTPEKQKSKVAQTGKLKLSEYSAITTLFAHRPEEAPEITWVDDKPLTIIDNHW